MKKNLFLLLTFILSACASQPQVTSTNLTNAENTPVSTQTPTLIPTPIEIPLETLSVEEIVQKYLADEIDDISFLTAEQHTAFNVALAKKILAGEAIFPRNLTTEQYSTLVDAMNEQRGAKPIYVEVIDNNGNPSVMYYNTQKREMVTLAGTYEANKDIINQHAFDIYVKIDKNAQGLTTYIHPDTGEEIVVVNSGGVDWNWVGNKNNAWEQIDPIALENATINASLNRGDSILPVILINQNPAELVAFQGEAFSYHCAEVIIIKDGFGIRMFAGQEGAWRLINEGFSDEERIGTLNNSSNREKMPVNMVYYIFFENDQEKNWKRSMQEFDIVENAYSSGEVHKEIIEGYSAQENIVLRVPVIVKRK